MKKSLKLIVIVGIVLALVGFFNMNAIAAWFSTLSAIPNFMVFLAAVILLIFPGFPLIVYFYHKLNISLFRKGLSDGNGKMLSMVRVTELAEQFINEKWHPLIRGHPLTLVTHYRTPIREDTRPYLYVQFTTDQAFRDQRISEDGIEKNKLFSVVMDMQTGEPVINPDYFNTKSSEDNVRYTERYWFMGIKHKEETPMEKAMKDAMVQGMGFGLAQKTLEDKDKKEEENNGKKTD